MPADAPTGPAWLFCPGTQPERFQRAAQEADVAVLDLEDAVPLADKDRARRVVSSAVKSLDPARTVVRVNALDTAAGLGDLHALRETPLRYVMLPKVAAPLSNTDALGPLLFVGLCETARGVQTASSIADHPQCCGLAWGGQDLAADLGTTPLGRDGLTLHPTGHYARMRLRYAAAASGIAAVDTVWTAIKDEQGLQQEAQEAADLAFDGKLVIHPRQVPVVRTAFGRASAGELAWAHHVIQAFESSTLSDSGVVVVDGEMVDAPVVARARTLLSKHGSR